MANIAQTVISDFISTALPTNSTPSICTLLYRELAFRRLKNSAYSLRAFARDLGVSNTALSEVMAQKRKFSAKNSRLIRQKLGLSPEEFSMDAGAAPTSSTKINTHLIERQMIRDDEFSLISDWYHYGILSLATLKHNKSDPKWIAERLNISISESESALERLARLGLLRISSGKLHRSSLPICTSNDVPSLALRNFHRQNLRLAERSLNEDAVELRDFFALTFSIDPKKIPIAKRIMREAFNKIDHLMSEGDHSEVYTLSTQFFPITRITT